MGPDPSSPPPPPGDPKKSPPNKDRQVNWRVLLLFAFAAGVLGLAFFVNNQREAKLSYNEFLEFLRQQQVVQDNQQYPFYLETKNAGQLVIVKGHLADRSLVKWGKPEPFLVQYDAESQGDLIPEELRAEAELQTSDALVTPPEANEMTIRDLRSKVLSGAIVRNQDKFPLRLLHEQRANGSTYLSGFIRTPQALDEGALKDVNYRPFSVELSTSINRETLSHLKKDYGLREKPDSGYAESMFFTLLPILLLVLLLFFFFRHQMKAAGRGAMNFGKSKAKLLSLDGNKVTFKDVAGIQEAKEELWEVVDFLRDPKKFQKLGGMIPKGVLMVGPPGTGKTLLARAIAGEADVPFFSISGSDFVEMFVGVGASRVRDMFEQGKKQAPCLIFIDEIDAVGRHRGHGLGGGHDEREQTLNQLLVEMDGFDTQEGVIIIAATNRPDVLDPALLRPGRFDRQVTVSLPDVNGREEILRVHSKKIKLSPEVKLSIIARGTPGFSGAELANLINEAALLAARKGLKEVTQPELEEARDKVRWGRERRSLALTEDEKRKTAYHEAGHAILNIVLEHTDPLHKVTIIPRGPALGVTMMLPERDKFSYFKKEMLDELAVLMGGRVAEELVLDDIASGAMGDIRMATRLARNMVCEWGMSEKLGMVEYGEGQGEVFLARDISKQPNYSGATAKIIDEEVKSFIDEAYARAKSILSRNVDKLHLIADALMEYETLDGQHIKDLVEHGEMRDPPSSPQPPEVPEETDAKKSKKPVNESQEDDDGPLPGEVVGAPA